MQLEITDARCIELLTKQGLAHNADEWLTAQLEKSESDSVLPRQLVLGEFPQAIVDDASFGMFYVDRYPNPVKLYVKVNEGNEPVTKNVTDLFEKTIAKKVARSGGIFLTRGPSITGKRAFQVDYNPVDQNVYIYIAFASVNLRYAAEVIDLIIRLTPEVNSNIDHVIEENNRMKHSIATIIKEFERLNLTDMDSDKPSDDGIVQDDFHGIAEAFFKAEIEVSQNFGGINLSYLKRRFDEWRGTATGIPTDKFKNVFNDLLGAHNWFNDASCGKVKTNEQLKSWTGAEDVDIREVGTLRVRNGWKNYKMKNAPSCEFKKRRH